MTTPIEYVTVPSRGLNTNHEIDVQTHAKKLNEIIAAVNHQAELLAQVAYDPKCDEELQRERANTQFAVDHIRGKE